MHQKDLRASNSKKFPMTEITTELSQKIRNVGFVCACLVVAVHISHPTSGSGQWLDMVLAGGLSKVAVPIFFAISGFLLAGKMTESGWWKREVLKRVRSLVVPFYCWSFIAFAVATVETVIVARFHGATLRSVTANVFNNGVPWLSVLGLNLTSMPSVGALWYVRNLVFFVLLSPLLFKWVKRCGYVGIVFLYVLYLVWTSFVVPWLPADVRGFFNYGFSIHGMVWFLFGAAIRLSPPPQLSAWMVAPFLCFGVVAWLISKCNLDVSIIRAAESVEVVALAGALWMTVPSGKWPGWMVSSAFPIFLMHGMFIGILQMNPSRIPGTGTVFGFLIHWLVPIGVSIVVALLLRCLCPRFSSLIFGGR